MNRENTEADNKKIKEKTIVGIGETVWDIFPEGPQLGGAPANFVYYGVLLGQNSILVSRIGNDELGRETLNRLSSYGMTTDYIQVDEKRATGTVNVTLDQKGVPAFAIQENVAWDYLEKSPALEALAKKASAVCFGSLAWRSRQSAETIEWFLSQVKPDCLLVLDINLRPPFYSEELLDFLLKKARILKVNDWELSFLGSIFFPYCLEEDAIINKLLEVYNLELIALTKGERGSRLITTHSQSSHPGFPVKVVDTVGAGDAFAAALVSGLLNGERLEEVNRKANWLASQVCSQEGAWTKVNVHEFNQEP